MVPNSTKTLQAIKFNSEDISLEILDQLVLPYSTTYISIKSIEDAFDAIKSMKVRGAPAIAIVGAFSIVVDTYIHLQKNDKPRTINDLINKIDYLITSRPTAVNLANACTEIKELLKNNYPTEALVDNRVFKGLFDYSIKLYEDDLNNNFKIGANGVKYIRETLRAQNFKGPFSIMTICNTGSLATSGHGTALGIIRSVYKDLGTPSEEGFWLDHVYPCETRPYNQGAKLTTYELNYENIPFTLICDNMASSLIKTLDSKRREDNTVAPIKFIIVGADRVVENGDTANKIGTFQLSAIARFFNTIFDDEQKSIKFIVAAPRTTIDLNTKSGDDIVIEERPAKELTTLTGPILNGDEIGEKLTVGIATPGITVWNPAFDVTPHTLIDAIITENPTVYIKDANGEFNLRI